MSGAIRGLDVAITFDFGSGEPIAAARTEAKALFFLAGWRLCAAGRAPLRIVCVGSPPDTVLSLAEGIDATVSERSPLVLENGVVFNRATAWQAPGVSDRRLALAAETLVLGDFLFALAAWPDHCLSAAPAEDPPLPEAAWVAVYRALDLPPPVERMRSLRAELGLPTDAGGADMLPAYHGAALLAPRACDLGGLWSAHLLRLAAILPGLAGLPPRVGAKLARNGKVALATSFQALLSGGERIYQRLPPVCDGRLPSFESARGAGGVRLFYAPDLFAGLYDLSQIQEHLRAFGTGLRQRVAEGVRGRGGDPWRANLTAAWRSRPVESALRRMYLREVRPALRRCGVYG